MRGSVREREWIGTSPGRWWMLVLPNAGRASRCPDLGLTAAAGARGLPVAEAVKRFAKSGMPIAAGASKRGAPHARLLSGRWRSSARCVAEGHGGSTDRSPPVCRSVLYVGTDWGNPPFNLNAVRNCRGVHQEGWQWCWMAMVLDGGR